MKTQIYVLLNVELSPWNWKEILNYLVEKIYNGKEIFQFAGVFQNIILFHIKFIHTRALLKSSYDILSLDL